MNWDVLTLMLLIIANLIMTISIYFKLYDLERIIKLLKFIARKVKGEECLKPKAASALIQAAELLALDARELYEKTKDEEFLKIAKKWEDFVRANKETVQKLIDKELED